MNSMHKTNEAIRVLEDRELDLIEGGRWQEAAAWGGGVAAAYWGGPMGLAVAVTAGVVNLLA